MSDNYGTTWWGRKWHRGLETIGLSYPDHRIVKGRAIAGRDGVEHLEITPGGVHAIVNDERDYPVSIEIDPYAKDQWDEALAAMGNSPSCVGALLAGALPKNIDDVLGHLGMILLPRKPRLGEDGSNLPQLRTSCPCSDPDAVCRHVIAVQLVSAARLDRDPFLVLLLRGGPTDNLPLRLRDARRMSHTSYFHPAA
ncbi:hypothetical protein [Natronoglycomyces albus]|uniref:SWIM-type domain-containing protein n=1 Tax=Natronoglycomyces albus TaxID=2811108 RepID=A0A895XU33_9ACTN|nr:hypothetical protein [Natronoglycomyces albus]QSB06845.1 hypothetical protein JQS30_08150 [Natronoglycomyces albus]